MKVFDHDGVSLHWRWDGQPTGPTVLLLNTLGTDLRLWDGFVPHLPSGHRVIRTRRSVLGGADVDRSETAKTDFDRRLYNRSVSVSIVVRTFLNLINQPAALFGSGDLVIWKDGYSFSVPG